MIKPWYWRSLPLKNRTGSEVFATLFYKNDSGIATLLESPYPNKSDRPQLTRYSICAGAPRILNGQPQMWTPPLGEVLPFLEKLLTGQGGQGGQRGQGEPARCGGHERCSDWRGQGDKGTILSPHLPIPPSPPSRLPPSPPLPFTGGWLGWLGYDIAWEIEELPRDKIDPLPFPVAFWYEPECFAILDHAQQILWLAASHPSGLDELQEKLEETTRLGGLGGLGGLGAISPLSPPSSPPPPLPPSSPHFLTSQEDYETAVNRAQKYIQAGDIFQANISLRFQASTTACGWEIYQALQKINPSPFASYWQTPWGEVISCSPERLVQLEKGRDAIYRVSTRPIAGTRSRGTTKQQDIELAQDLLSNTKERAEHIMLVDLERNDLGRVCEWGSVCVDELLTIERYSHVMHLVSNVKGTLKSTSTPIDLIRALFPGGTITGCPKVRCMEIIEELEPVRRNLFYGSCGYLDWRGNLDLNILIRTLLLTPPSPSSSSSPPPLNTVWGQVGAGIVADSNPEREWYESLHKAQAQLQALKMQK
ncbi:anthranilate synthase component I [Tolypothrix sp. NIES-4075]|uniref:anthranilate synthase component I n=1 Tax=Tolypothrix sp. NIES-4075 TaxID=2005459 RepID=UPI000B5C8D31|nr:anthranilate synthase component I [Tolypothrix sp. NIES-4075]GAX43540.1 anthranilate synthase component I [Tolypothrix sp. NIES-4075]